MKETNINQLSSDINLDDEESSLLNKPITIKFLLKFTIPTIISFLIMSIFGTIDGVFASRGISEEALGAINFVMPFFSFAMAIGSMLSMGGAALVAKKKGKGLEQEARENFTLLTLVAIISSIIIAVISWILREPLLRMLGTDMAVFGYALDYIQPLILMLPSIIVGWFFVQFVVTEGRPILAMITSSSGAVVSTLLNALFVFVLDMGVMGLAIATGIGYSVPVIIGIIYFTTNKKGTLYFVCPKWDVHAIGRSSLNGISEMIIMMAGTVTTIAMNNILVRMDGVGWHGVAAAGIVLASQAIFASFFWGYSIGVAPVVSYNFGKKISEEKNNSLENKGHNNIKKLYKKSLLIIGALSVIAIIFATILADLLVRVYVSPGTCPYTGIDLHAMTVRGFRIAIIAYIFMGFNIFASVWFTAFNDALVSGFMSVMRTFVFTLSLLIGLSYLFGLTGAWIALPAAETLSIVMTIFFLIKMGKKYHYLDRK